MLDMFGPWYAVPPVMTLLSEWWYEFQMIFVFSLPSVIYFLPLWEAQHKIVGMKQGKVACRKGNPCCNYEEKNHSGGC